jgi:hypothetical protein
MGDLFSNFFRRPLPIGIAVLVAKVSGMDAVCGPSFRDLHLVPHYCMVEFEEAGDKGVILGLLHPQSSSFFTGKFEPSHPVTFPHRALSIFISLATRRYERASHLAVAKQWQLTTMNRFLDNGLPPRVLASFRI